MASSESGATPITSLVGVAVFLSFLLLSTQVLLYLFTASVVQAAAVDGASHGALVPSASSVAAARQRTTEVLGGLADDAVVSGLLDTDLVGDVVEVHVSVRLPSLLGGLGFTRIERAARVRRGP